MAVEGGAAALLPISCRRRLLLTNRLYRAIAGDVLFWYFYKTLVAYLGNWVSESLDLFLSFNVHSWYFNLALMKILNFELIIIIIIIIEYM